MASYPTIDYLPDLTFSEMYNAGTLFFQSDPRPSVGWDNTASVYGSEPYAILRDTYSIQCIAGATCSVFSTSYFDPFILLVYDKYGNVIAANDESDDPPDYYLSDGGLYSQDVLFDLVAPYTGTYYVSASWNQGSFYSFYSLSVYEDVGTSLNSIAGTASANYLMGTRGNDLIAGFAGSDSIVGGSANDTLIGGDGNDTLAGGDGTDKLDGGAGNDRADGGTGNDSMTGGAGNDSYTVQSTGDKTIEVAAGGSADSVSSSITWTLGTEVEKLTLTGTSAINGTGNTLANTITGNTASNSLSGGSGNDLLVGRSGNDVLVGGTGNDSLTGNSGLDTFRFSSALNSSTNVDKLLDFNVTDDRLQFENSIFTKLATTGVLSASYFRANISGAASDSNDFVLYETDTGKLFYDADGSGAGSKVWVVTLTTLPALTSADIFVT